VVCGVQVARTAQPAGAYTWLVTFRALVGHVNLLHVDYSTLYGSNARAVVTEVVAGSNKTLTGTNPRLTVYEKVAGQPSYTAQYTVDTPGKYLTRVSQLLPGGLSAQVPSPLPTFSSHAHCIISCGLFLLVVCAPVSVSTTTTSFCTAPRCLSAWTPR